MKKLITLAAAALLSLGAFAQMPTPADQRAKCAGKTVAGAPCKRPAATGKSFCFQHDDTRPRCGAPTATGGKCKNGVKIAGEHCKMHAGK